MKYYVEIVEFSTDAVIKRLGPESSEHNADRLDRGVNINLNHRDYFTRIVTEPTEQPKE